MLGRQGNLCAPREGFEQEAWGGILLERDSSCAQPRGVHVRSAGIWQQTYSTETAC
jgi:hypothetical protein